VAGPWRTPGPQGLSAAKTMPMIKRLSAAAPEISTGAADML